MARMFKRSVRTFIAIAAPPLCSLCSPDHKRVQSRHSGTTGPGAGSGSGDPELQGPGGACSARACPSHASQQPLHIKVFSDLVILFPAVSIDIQVLSDLAFILFILFILQILIQTRRRRGGGQAPALRKKARLGARSARACPSHASQQPLCILRSSRTLLSCSC